MTPERWQLVKPIFFHASELEVDARQRYVDEACGNDAELKREVDSLLAVSLSEEAVLDRPVSQFVTLDDIESIDSSLVGQRLGAYQLVECLGRGGMGEVYRAHRVDSGFEMQVAIKLVRAGSGSDLLRRFHAERQILASLDHPGIARMLDGGVTPTGEPYLVMELVIGEPIDLYCEKRELSIAERLLLFRQVCAAVSYAHRRLVVHRDLKPANILVTAQGAVKLLDFGIAKLLTADLPDRETAEVTRTTVRAMTPQFSSPEQILGLPITTASDVYSLGVVLFHLLTGDSPYRNAIVSTRDAIRDVCETEPLIPSAAAWKSVADGKNRPLLNRDLDHITLRALRKEPEERYGSADEFSEDVRRYLAGLPVLASGDQMSYRIRKFWGRHWLAVTTAGLFVTVLIVALGFYAREARIAEEQRALAAQRFADVRQLATTFMFKVNDAIDELPGAAAARNLIATTSQSYLDSLAKQAGADRGLQKELAKSYERLADIQGMLNTQNLGLHHEALINYAASLSLLEKLTSGQPPDPAILSTMSLIHTKRSELLLMVNGDVQSAATESKQAVALLDSVVSMKPDDLDARQLLAQAYAADAFVEGYADQYDAAIVVADKAIAIAEDIYRQRPSDRSVGRLLSRVYSRATVFPPRMMTSAEIERGLDISRKAMVIDQQLLATEKNPTVEQRRSVSVDWAGIGSYLFQKGDFSGSAENYARAQAVLESIPADSNNVQAGVDLAKLQVNRGRALRWAGRLDEANVLLVKNLALFDELLKHTDAKDVQFLRTEAQEELGSIEMLRAQKATDPVRQRQHWTAAHDFFLKCDQQFKSILEGTGATLNYQDQQPVDQAAAGVKISEAALQELHAS
jgi:serine/threonine protein kinase/tetratricopeptide (TPR) repeat protein